jgi:hypothetical protein
MVAEITKLLCSEEERVAGGPILFSTLPKGDKKDQHKETEEEGHIQLTLSSQTVNKA